MKSLYTALALVLLTVSCSDNMPAESYYTFTGEMMNDYLQSRSQYSEFCRIMERAQHSQRGVNLMDLVSTYGQYTCFAPTNDAVQEYLDRWGYESVDDIPYDLCDTIARTHFVAGRIYDTDDLRGSTSIPTVNMNGRYIQVQEAYAYIEDGDTIYTADSLAIVDKADVRPTFRLNRSACVSFNECNDSVENGMVHTVYSMVNSSNQTVADLLLENPEVSLFCEAMDAVGLTDYIRSRIKDESWDPDQYEDKLLYSGGQWDYCHIPETKNYGFTVFACPDDVLAERYGITSLQEFYDYARQIYGGDALDVTDPSNADALTHWRSPLRRLVGYNILKTKGMYDDLTTICTIDFNVANPTEWYPTMDSLTTIKIEKLYVTSWIIYDDDVRKDLYLNRGDFRRNITDQGIHVRSDVDDQYTNEGLNGVYYLTDGLADYGEDTKTRIFNTRMRMDLYYMFPELMTNSIRDGRTDNDGADSANPDKTVTSPNYWFPAGYIDNLTVNDDGVFLFQSQHNGYDCYEGDEFNCASETGSYDVTFQLPSVPTGTYQVRLGFCAMASRGICQFYLDGTPEGSPFDQRNEGLSDRIGWFALTQTSKSTDEVESAKKAMHNLGWYHGPRSVYRYTAAGVADGSNAEKIYQCNNSGTIRYVMATVTLDEDVQHYVRIKSIWALGGALVMIDYLELVPKSVYGLADSELAENDY